ncbi:hypothetical protein FSP39_003161 [Pinctada imbricata]|uniref:Uncharacterized protein n=1 Tax=Pinctada imbricata TaxID=66713 RepID=A0AA88Y8S8_PINIB|nr:hypothetical protein FSP39_003161 [Pinctada imbricata]
MNIIVNFADENGQLQDLACSTKETKSESDVKKKYGVIDFADMAYSCYIFEIGRVLMSFMKDLPGLDPRYLVGYFLSGYLRHRKLSKEELDLLPDCINGVLCQCIVIGDRDFRKHPKDANLRTKIEFAWSQLYKVKSVSLQDFHDIWGSILQQDGIHEQSLVHDDIQSDIRTQNTDVIV